MGKMCVLACALGIAACSSGSGPSTGTGTGTGSGSSAVAAKPVVVKPVGEAAAKLLAGWFTAFDADTAEPLRAYYAAHWTPLVAQIDYASGFRTGTGGFEVKKIEPRSATRAVATVKEKSSDQFAVATLDIDAADPEHVIGFNLEGIDTPAEYLTDDERTARTLDDTRRKALIAGIAKELRAHYVFPDKAEAMIAALAAHDAHGDYAAVTSSLDFANDVTRDLRDVSHDLHLGVMFGRARGPAPAAGAGSGSDKPPADDRLAQAKSMNFGFGAIERMPNNVARVVIDSFPDIADVPAARDAIGALMSPVADADALIVDLRGNHGGWPETVALDASYLFDAAPVHLNDMYSRDTGKTTPSWTLAKVPGKRFGGKKPIYVLTSAHTFSGGEELAYDLQTQHRATLVGETTGGGAHPTGMQRLDEWFAIAVPSGRPINPITKTDWEGTGVVPDVKTTADGALVEAHARAVAEIAAATKHP